MHRVPQAVMVNWGGLPPHLEHLHHPEVKAMIENEQQNRYEYIAHKEEHQKAQDQFEKGLNDGN